MKMMIKVLKVKDGDKDEVETENDVDEAGIIVTEFALLEMFITLVKELFKTVIFVLSSCVAANILFTAGVKLFLDCLYLIDSMSLVTTCTCMDWCVLPIHIRIRMLYTYLKNMN